MLRTFTWCVDAGATEEIELKTNVTQFGDGYEQNISVGINNRKGQWAYTRTAQKAEIQEIKAFFDTHKGADSFLWDSPLDGELRVKAGEYQLNKVGGLIWRISTTFTQVFYP